MFKRITHFLILFTLLCGSLLASPVARVAAGTTESDISPGGMLNSDDTLKLDGSFSGTLDLQDWQVNLDPFRGPTLQPANSNNWQSMGNGTNGTVEAVAIDSNGYVYIGGSFNAICGNAACNSGNITVFNLAVWNGSNWSGLGGYGVNGGIYTIAISGSNIYIGGIFSTICADALCNSGTSARNIARWNGSTWSGLGNGLDSFVFALAVNGNTVYAGGNFISSCGNSSCNSGNLTVNYIAKWDGIQWSSIGFGLTHAVYALAVNGSDLYVGGYFTQLCGNPACSAGNTTVNYITKWSSATSTWYALGNGLDDGVRAISLDSNNTVFVGGFFIKACGNLTCNSGNIVVNHVAKWSGSAWSALGGGVNNDIYAIAVNGTNVYAGGYLTQLCGNAACTSGNTTANYIALWNGSAWSMPANGFDNFTYALAANSGAVYGGGTFTQTCGNAACNSGNSVANRVAKLSVPIKKTIYSTGTQDGWVLESSETSGLGGSLNNTVTTFRLGDDATRKQYIGILSFKTSSIPDTAVITAVALKVKKQGIIGGGDPLTTFQGFMVDLKKGFFGTTALQASDFQTAANKTYGPFNPALVSGWYSINLTSGKAYINILSTNGGLTQVRLRFKLDDNNDAVTNYLSLFSGDAPTASRPRLVVTYYVP